MGHKWIELCRQAIPEGSSGPGVPQHLLAMYDAIQGVSVREGLPQLLARPIVQLGLAGREVIWTIEADSEEQSVIPFLELSEDRQESVRAEIADFERKLVAKLPTDSTEATGAAPEVWKARVSSPDDSYIYMVNDEIAITGWGFPYQTPAPGGCNDGPTGSEGNGPNWIERSLGIIKVNMVRVAFLVAVLSLAFFAGTQSSRLEPTQRHLIQKSEDEPKATNRVRDSETLVPQRPEASSLQSDGSAFIEATVLESIIQLTTKKGWRDVSWSIHIAADAPEYVKEDPQDYIAFHHERDSSGSTAHGPVVFLRVRPDPVRAFRVEIAARDPLHGSGTSILYVGARPETPPK